MTEPGRTLEVTRKSELLKTNAKFYLIKKPEIILFIIVFEQFECSKCLLLLKYFSLAVVLSLVCLLNLT